jgi:hypothetical protein
VDGRSPDRRPELIGGDPGEGEAVVDQLLGSEFIEAYGDAPA